MTINIYWVNNLSDWGYYTTFAKLLLQYIFINITWHSEAVPLCSYYNSTGLVSGSLRQDKKYGSWIKVLCFLSTAYLDYLNNYINPCHWIRSQTASLIIAQMFSSIFLLNPAAAVVMRWLIIFDCNCTWLCWGQKHNHCQLLLEIASTMDHSKLLCHFKSLGFAQSHQNGLQSFSLQCLYQWEQTRFPFSPASDPIKARSLSLLSGL